MHAIAAQCQDGKIAGEGQPSSTARPSYFSSAVQSSSLPAHQTGRRPMTLLSSQFNIANQTMTTQTPDVYYHTTTNPEEETATLNSHHHTSSVEGETTNLAPTMTETPHPDLESPSPSLQLSQTSTSYHDNESIIRLASSELVTTTKHVSGSSESTLEVLQTSTSFTAIETIVGTISSTLQSPQVSTSKTSSGYATASSSVSSACLFSTSNSLATDGGFEDGLNPFEVAPGSMSSSDFSFAVKPSADSPIPESRLCKYYFEVDYTGGSTASTIGFLYQIPTQRGMRYSLNFMALLDSQITTPVARALNERLPNPFQAIWQVCVGGFIIAFEDGDNGSSWKTYHGTFVAHGQDSIEITITGQGRDVYFAFDNFIVTAVPEESSAVFMHQHQASSSFLAASTSSLAVPEKSSVFMHHHHRASSSSLPVHSKHPLHEGHISTRSHTVTVTNDYNPAPTHTHSFAPGEHSSSMRTNTTATTWHSSSSTLLSPSSTVPLCPFTTSGSLITDGGFEDNQNFFTTATKAGLPTVTATPFPATSLPVPNANACSYVLDVDISSRGGSTLILAYTFDAVPGEIYLVSFDTLACGIGGVNDKWTANIGRSLVASGNAWYGSGGGCGSWITKQGSFVASAVNQLSLSFDVVDSVESDVYFDNFIIVPANPPAPTS